MHLRCVIKGGDKKEQGVNSGEKFRAAKDFTLSPSREEKGICRIAVQKMGGDSGEGKVSGEEFLARGFSNGEGPSG